jgi:transposase
MRPKIPDLQQALVGHFSDHHTRLCRRMLAHIDGLTATITDLAPTSIPQSRLFTPDRRRLSSIPGVSARVAEVIIAETSGDMIRFPTLPQLAS